MRVPAFGPGLLQTDHSAPYWHLPLLTVSVQVPVPGWVQRWRQRRANARALKDAWDIDIDRWLVDKAPTPVEIWAQNAIDTTARWGPWNGADSNSIQAGTITSDHIQTRTLAVKQRANTVVINMDRDGSVNHHERRVHLGIDPGNPDGFAIYEGELDLCMTKGEEDRELYRQAIRDYGSRPWHPPARRELEVLKLVDVEPEWDVPSMLDAHRNHCTALERPMKPTQGLVAATPIYAEVATYMFDPRHEMGPRQRSWHRHNRNQPTSTTRRKRKGRK